jgi:predicted DNA-binding mobile mystery protein A
MQVKDCMKSKIRAILLSGLDSSIGILSEAQPAAIKPARGWLRAIREAIGMTQTEAALKIAVQRQSFAQFEFAEERGTISVASLQRAAGALDCELVYFVVPRGSPGRTFGELARSRDPQWSHQDATEHSMALETPHSST